MFLDKDEYLIDQLKPIALKKVLNNFNLISLLYILVSHESQFLLQYILIILEEGGHPLVRPSNGVDQVKNFIEGKGLSDLKILEVLVIVKIEILGKFLKVLHDVFKIVDTEADVEFEELQDFMDLLLVGVSDCH